MKKDIIITEYEESYAPSLADMWNNSKEGWNSIDFSTNAENTRQSEKTQVYINLLLAFDKSRIEYGKPKVIGYCKLAKCNYDEQALEIPLLNVLPSHHNQKIGKTLILKAAEITASLKYDRLYLDLESFCSNKCSLDFNIKSSSNIEFDPENIKEELQAMEKKSIAVKYKINKGGLFHKKSAIDFLLQNNKIGYYKDIFDRFYTHNSICQL